MRKIILALCFAVITFSLAGCGTEGEKHTEAEAVHVITDSDGHQERVSKNAKVVSLYGSYAECWLLSGGSLTGVTQDAIDERHLDLPDDVKIVGSVKEPNLEVILSLNPDYVILDKDIVAQAGLKENFEQMHIGYGYFSMDTFDEYASFMEQFCAVNEREDLYEANVSCVKEQIAAIKKDAAEKINKNDPPEVLLLRAYTTGVKAKSDDNLAGIILKELGCKNIVDQYPSMLEDLSVEQIIKQDPDYIFVLTMGDENKALAYLNSNVTSNPAWSNLSAVINDRYIVLPKELFHYKPNNRWGESYKFLMDVLAQQ